jgi:hypothetical protein
MSFFSFLFGPSDGGPLPYPNESPEGLAARWVRWAAASDVARNPITDETGRYTSRNQPEDVWFLAGCFGGAVERTCSIPARKKLFLPAINLWTFGARQPSELPDAFGYLHIDGTEISLDVIATPQPFFVKGTRKNPVTGTSSKVSVVVWGLWKQIDPLIPGQHKIRVGGGDGHGFRVDVTYQITVDFG